MLEVAAHRLGETTGRDELAQKVGWFSLTARQ